MSVNFTSLREAQRRERENQNQLQPLPAGFYEELSEYFCAKALAAKEARGRDGEGFKDAVAEQHEKELENARSAFLDLFERRLKKISSMALEAADEGAVVDAASMAPMEREMFERLSTHFRDGRKAMLSTVFERRQEILKKAVPKIRVRFTGAVPSFVGSDMAPYGPFAAGDEAELPERNARLLVEKGRAEELKP